MTYRWVDHTAEVELAIEAATEEDVFADAMRAYAELVAREPGGEPARREVTVAAPDRATLLAAWLDELVFLAETDAFVPERLSSFALEDGRVRATVDGRIDAPAPLVKAVTYHRLEYRREQEGFRARLVLDV
jgi:SHS2 domain-containing protein